MRPYHLNSEVWKLFRHHNLCCTPQEEQDYRFTNTDTVPLPDNVFAQNIDWMLRCCLNSHPATRDMTIQYGQEQGLGIAVAVFDSAVRVSDKFLAFGSAHDDVPCGEDDIAIGGPFVCDHLVLEL
jgi:hypothetical protein